MTSVFITKSAKILDASAESIELVSRSLLEGGVVALPTETVYGLGALISHEGAIRKVFEVKSRPFIDPLIVHVLDLPSLFSLVDIDDVLFNKVRALTDAFSPGPLTFILKKKKSVSDMITAGKKTVAIRLPAHRLFREVLLRLRCPIAAPSANPFGYLSPTTAEHVFDSIGDKIDYILDGGPCKFGVESTILDLSSKKPKVLRPGAVTPEMIGDVLREEIQPYESLVSSDPSAPGLLKQHYSPKTKLRLFQKGDPEVFHDGKIAFVYLSRAEVNPDASGEKFWLSETGELKEIAQNVFALLRALDKQSFDIIYCQTPPNSGMGVAINDRLGRAAAKFA